MFGVGDLFMILLGGGALASKSIKSKEAQFDSCVKQELEEHFVKRYTDSELEERVTLDVLDPEKYDDIWNRIEKYKNENGIVYLEDSKNPYSPWNQYACIKRVPFRDSRGSLQGKNRAESDLLEHYRSAAIAMLMHTYGKMSTHNAQQVAMHATTNELSSWLKNGWPKGVNVNSITVDDFKRDVADTPHKTVGAARVLTLIAVCAALIYVCATGKDNMEPVTSLIVGIASLCFLVYMAVAWITK